METERKYKHVCERGHTTILLSITETHFIVTSCLGFNHDAPVIIQMFLKPVELPVCMLKGKFYCMTFKDSR